MIKTFSTNSGTQAYNRGLQLNNKFSIEYILTFAYKKTKTNTFIEFRIIDFLNYLKFPQESSYIKLQRYPCNVNSSYLKRLPFVLISLPFLRSSESYLHVIDWMCALISFPLLDLHCRADKKEILLYYRLSILNHLHALVIHKWY